MSVPTRNVRSPFPLIVELVSKFKRATLDFIYPPNCLLCQVELPANEGRTGDASAPFCLPCRSKLATPQGNACRRCGAPVGPFTIAEDHCILCRRENFAFDEVIRLGLYRDELRVACLTAKNPGGEFLAVTLADLLFESQTASLTGQKWDVVTAVPEHWLKRTVRPHYAAESLARRISTRLNVRLSTGILAKVRWTPKQAKSPPAQRRLQQQGAFRAAKSKLQGQSILLVDDILTTGATADAAARELKRAGASRVVVAVIAVSPPRA